MLRMGTRLIAPAVYNRDRVAAAMAGANGFHVIGFGEEDVPSEQSKADQRRKAAAKKNDGGLWGLFKVVGSAIFIALLIRTFLYEPFNIPSESMLPGLKKGDYLFVSKFSYGYSNFSLPFSPSIIDGRVLSSAPTRGDVAVFRQPTNVKIDFIKRVIGLPGDRIQVKDGILQINGTPVKREGPIARPEIDKRHAEALIGKREFDASSNPNGAHWGRECGDRAAKLYYETLPNGVKHTILECGDNLGADNTRVYVVPAGHYFMMGDNRDNSTDSRFSSVGYVPLKNFIGRAEFIFFSSNGYGRIWEIWKWPSSIRWNRLLRGVR